MNSYGLDFGTTNTSLSVNVGGHVQMVNIDPLNPNPRVMRSVLFFDEDGGVAAGQEAVDKYLEDVDSGRLLRSIKTLLPSKIFSNTMIGARYYNAVDLVSIFLSNVRARALKVGEEVEEVIIGRPVIFSEDQATDKMAEERLRQAAMKAGFKRVSFQLEPIAAALQYESTLPAGESRLVLVGDFGGGTSDFTIMQLGANKSDDRKQDILSVGGVYIGGDTFDSLLMWEKIGHLLGRGTKYIGIGGKIQNIPNHIVHAVRNWHTIPLLRDRRIRDKIQEIIYSAEQGGREPMENLAHLIEHNLGILLFQSVENAKCELSSSEEATIAFDGLAHPIRQEVQRTEFENFLVESLEKIDQCVTDTLVSASIKPGQIDNVFLTGGTSQVPSVRRLFEQRFGEQKLSAQDAFTSVAYGLGVSAGSNFN